MAYAVGAGSGVFTAEQIAKLEEGTRQLVDEMSQQYRAKIAELTEQMAHMEKLRSYPPWQRQDGRHSPGQAHHVRR